MADGLVAIPWQRQYYLTQSTLNLLGRAVELAGHNILVNDAWRPYAKQKYYWDGWVNRLPGFNLASNPDDPNAQNNHLRGAAVDIANQSDIAAMKAAGFTQDPSEWWHFNNPNWRGMPIIRENTTSAGGVATPLTPVINQGEMDMSFSLVKDAQSPTIWVVSLVTGKYAGIANQYHLGLLKRAKVNNADDPMLLAELDIVKSYLSAIGPATTVQAAGQATPWNPTAAQLAAIGAGVKVPAFPTKLTGELS